MKEEYLLLPQNLQGNKEEFSSLPQAQAGDKILPSVPQLCATLKEGSDV